MARAPRRPAPSSSTGRPSRPGCCCRRARANPSQKNTRTIYPRRSAARWRPARHRPTPPPAEPDPDAWLADVPVVEADPVRRSPAPVAAGHDRACGPARAGGARAAEAHRAADRRQRPGRLRGMVREAAEAAVRAHGPAGQHPGRHRGGHQAQPALDARAVSELLPPAGAGASVRPGLRQRRGAGARAPPAAPAAPTPAIPALRARVARLLDRAAPRLPEELDLAEAICAIKWPKWPDYRGPIDLGAAAPGAGRHADRRGDAQLARRQGDRARVGGTASRPTP